MSTKATTRQVETARLILEGTPPAEAMRQAGYSEGHIRSASGEVVALLRSRGLLPTAEDVRSVKDRVVAILQEAAPDVAAELVRIATSESATPGERIAAAKLLFDRGLGPVPRRHELSLEDAGAVLDELLAIAPGVLGDHGQAEALAAAWREHLAKRKASGA